MQNGKIMVLMVGLPGSGKSTMAKGIADTLQKTYGDVCILSTDNIWEDDTKNHYFFDMEFLGAAHKINIAKCKLACQKELCVIIDNTNLSNKERKPYIDIAKENNYSVFIVESSTLWRDDASECYKRNKHGVPFDVIVRMREKLLNDRKVRNQQDDNISLSSIYRILKGGVQ